MNTMKSYKFNLVNDLPKVWEAFIFLPRYIRNYSAFSMDLEEVSNFKSLIEGSTNDFWMSFFLYDNKEFLSTLSISYCQGSTVVSLSSNSDRAKKILSGMFYYLTHVKNIYIKNPDSNQDAFNLLCSEINK